MKLRVFLIGLIALVGSEVSSNSNKSCIIFGIQDRILNVRLERFFTLRDSDLAAGTADLLIIVDEVLFQARFIEDTKLREEVETTGRKVQAVLIRLIEDVLTSKEAKNTEAQKNIISSLTDFKDENVLILIAQFKNLSEEFSTALLHPEKLGLATNIFVYAYEYDLLHPADDPKRRALQERRIALLTKESGFRIPFRTEADFVKIERPTREQMQRGNVELIMLLVEVSDKGNEEDKQAVSTVVLYLDEQGAVRNPDFSLSSIDNNVFEALVFLIQRHPKTIALAIRGMYEELLGTKDSKDLSYNCFNIGLNNAASDESVHVINPRTSIRKKTLLGENGTRHAVDMQMSHSLIALGSKPQRISWFDDIWFNRFEGQKITTKDQVRALIHERRRIRIEANVKDFLKKDFGLIVGFGRGYMETLHQYFPLGEDHTPASDFSILYKLSDEVYKGYLTILPNTVLSRALLPKGSRIYDDVAYYKILPIGQFISIEDGHIVALRYVPLDPVSKEQQVQTIIESYPHLKELSLLVDLSTLDIDLIIRLHLHLNLKKFELVGMLNNNGTPARIFPHPYVVEKPVHRSRLERDLLKNRLSISPKEIPDSSIRIPPPLPEYRVTEDGKAIELVETSLKRSLADRIVSFIKRSTTENMLVFDGSKIEGLSEIGDFKVVGDAIYVFDPKSGVFYKDGKDIFEIDPHSINLKDHTWEVLPDGGIILQTKLPGVYKIVPSRINEKNEIYFEVLFDPKKFPDKILGIDPDRKLWKYQDGSIYIKGLNFLLRRGEFVYYDPNDFFFKEGEKFYEYTKNNTTFFKNRYKLGSEAYRNTIQLMFLLDSYFKPKYGDKHSTEHKKDDLHPKTYWKLLGTQEFWTIYKDHFVIVERDDSDPAFKGEQFNYRIFVDNKLVGIYSNIDEFRYVEIYEKDRTKLFSLDNHYYQNPGSGRETKSYNETDVLRIEIDMAGILSE